LEKAFRAGIRNWEKERIIMDIIKAIKERKSTRGYLPKPVPAAIVREILDISRRAPSALNTQPWEITAVAGKALENIRQENVKLLEAQVPVEEHSDYPAFYKPRSRELGIELFRLMGIHREDREARNQWIQRGFRFFDAPVGIVISVDKSLLGDSAWATWAIHDCGAIAQTGCLVAMEYGLGTCIEAAGVAYRDVIKKHTGISKDKEVVIGISLGYPDPDFTANANNSKRVPFDEVISLLGF